MRVIQSFWTRNSDKLLALKGSWASLESSLACWALNNELLNRFYDLELYTDSFGHHVLVDVLGLKYDKVHFVFDEFEYPFDSRLWCYNKIYVYSIQSSPFLHIDGDVFIWRPFPSRLLQAEIIAQNIEIDLPNYVKCLEEINRTFEYVPKDYFKIALGESVLASNAGIFGGQNTDVFKELRVTAYDFLSNNLLNIGEVSTGFLNIMSEQLPINKIAKKRNLKIEYLLPSAEPPNYLELNHFHSIYDSKGWYLHVMGAKKNYITCEFIIRQLLVENIDSFFKIISHIHCSINEYFETCLSRLILSKEDNFYLNSASKLLIETNLLDQERREDLTYLVLEIGEWMDGCLDKILLLASQGNIIRLKKGVLALSKLNETGKNLSFRLSPFFRLFESKWLWYDENDFMSHDFTTQLKYNLENSAKSYHVAYFECYFHCRFVPKLLDGLDLIIISFFQHVEHETYDSMLNSINKFACNTLNVDLFYLVDENILDERIRLFISLNWLENEGSD